MPCTNETDLSYYDNKLKDWVLTQSTKTVPSSLYQWTKTNKVGAVSIWPVGRTELKPVIDFMFTETLPLSGDKGPENPSAISGVSSIGLTVCQEEDVDEHSYTLSLGGTYYGGTADFATGVMTVTWEGKILDGTEAELSLMSIATDARLAYNIVDAGLSVPVGGYSVSICSHASNYNAYNGGIWGDFCVRNSGYFMMQDKNHVIGTTIEAYRTWLSTQYANGTPVTFAYAVVTPFTVQLTPIEILSLAQIDKYTPRLNTIYTDASSVRVGYVKSPIREEYELQQAIVSQGGNI